MNAVTAYLNSEIDVVPYIEAPNGYKTLGKVCLLRKTIYGLKESIGQWSKDLAQSMIWASLKRYVLDYSTFAKILNTSKVVIVIVYVDNFLLFGQDIQEINTIKKYLDTITSWKIWGYSINSRELSWIKILIKKQSLYPRSYISANHLTILVLRIVNVLSLK